MAKPYREGKGWAVRVRCKGQDIYLKNFKTEAAARKAAEEQRVSIAKSGQPARLGPQRTSVALAIQAYAKERLPFLKGARQDAQRLNRYLRAVGLEVISLTPARKSSAEGGAVYWKVSLVDEPAERHVPNSLKKHRDAQRNKGARSETLRLHLARTAMADVTPHQVQLLIDAMRQEGYKPATLALERAELRRLFNYARQTWLWPRPEINPGSGLNMPSVDNGRSRIISNDEWQRLMAVLGEYGNAYAVPAMALLLETTMRSSEPLLHARWCDIDWQRCVLRLPDAKAGARDVPLSPNAIRVLEDLLQRAGNPDPETNILPTTYEALKKAWKVACKKAGVDNARMHDLRHTGTTRYAIEYGGNLPVLKIITGHKTDSQLARYINLKADDVVRMMHGRPLDEGSAPAGLSASYLMPRPEPEPQPQTEPPAVVAIPEPQLPESLPDNVVVFPGMRRAA